jgi:hypothetical protein
VSLGRCESELNDDVDENKGDAVAVGNALWF